ncbi:type VI secretion system contractile sheath small subunit [Ramlibacter sp.]|uniref:type VI secretion system contractile sheath small subunit n=1 Tax=Ramlibacter sp. TaxID=1917967 RepID=UPI002D5CD842|nr:type VI secretion system contractile sheath small subunit [Ramlibacter sp.]HYD75476.1 type VI secretion system contractile sheath small subunit [Ramlibacter sp.]
MSTSSQKFIARNRAPRVQIEYDVETFGAQKKVNLPFVMGVMADLAGKSESEEAKKAVGDRKFLEIDVDNFDSRMAAIKPKLSFQVDNALTGEGKMPVEIEFESMEDFSPAKVAAKVDSLKKMMEARNQLASLLTYMDGKSGAEELLAKVLQDPALLKSISELPKGDAAAG